MKLGNKAAALAVAAMAVIAAASPARASDVFASTGPNYTSGNDSSTGGTWAASGSITTAGDFSMSASVDDPVEGVDATGANANIAIRGSTTLSLAPGTYTIKATLRDVVGSASETGYGRAVANADVGLVCQLDRCTPLSIGATDLGTSEEGTIDKDEVVLTARYAITQAHTVEVSFSSSARAASTHTGAHVVGVGAAYHGGTASIAVSGTVAEIVAVLE